MGLTLSMSHKSVITLLLLSLSTSSLGFSQIKEYLDMWNWETECWGEANVAQFHQFEDELVNQCLQTPVNEEVQKAAPRSVPQLARLTQSYSPAVLVPLTTLVPITFLRGILSSGGDELELDGTKQETVEAVFECLKYTGTAVVAASSVGLCGSVFVVNPWREGTNCDDQTDKAQHN